MMPPRSSPPGREERQPGRTTTRPRWSEREPKAPLELPSRPRGRRNEKRVRVHVPVVSGEIHVVCQVERLQEDFEALFGTQTKRLRRAQVDREVLGQVES